MQQIPGPAIMQKQPVKRHSLHPKILHEEGDFPLMWSSKE